MRTRRDDSEDTLIERLVAACVEAVQKHGLAEIEVVCADHPELVPRVRQRLSGLRRPAPEPLPEEIGPYRVLELLGLGGMGTVYLAEQTGAVRRRVALKVIKPGMDSEAVLARFAAERQALAMMEHDNIAKVFDAGCTDRGQPYFAMEYVKGLPLTEYCDSRRIGTRERLELFRSVCAGVQHAHYKGVIHRDLKPANVLVSEHQGKPVPKIIDFGVATATEGRLAGSTMFTEHGIVIGTPDYMSPEQALVGASDVDLRTDVYSLGVILYELLVGALPFSADELPRKTRDAEPPRPSTRISELGADAVRMAQFRRTTPVTLSREVRGDLDWIVMMAMERDRDRRYGSAGELSLDLQRYLQHEPVMAHPPTTAYRMKKLLRRYRGQVAACAAVFVALLAGIVSFALETRRAREAANVARDNAADAERDRQRAVAARTSERAAREEAEAILEQFNVLADIVKLDSAEAAEGGLYPALPENAERIRRWLEERAEPLARHLPDLQQTLDDLRERAEPVTAEELEAARRAHPRYEELRVLQGRLDSLRRARDVRDGKAVPARFTRQEGTSGDLAEMVDLARSLVVPARRTFGREAEGLALARRVWAESAKERGPLRMHAGRTLAFALLANGLDEEALAMREPTLAATPEPELTESRELLDWIEASVRTRDSEISLLESHVADLEAEVSARTWTFADPADRFLHESLSHLVEDVEAFTGDDGMLARAREQLSWAETVHDRSIASYQDRWDEARWALRVADGVVASALYRSDPPLQLTPQPGLVPIGMNPRTGLWEFYHLRSAADPDTIPEHGSDGSIEVSGDTGIVFVLIPGATTLLGAQNADPSQPNFDPHAEPDEVLAHAVIDPFFIARHEMTQGQWKRLSFGAEPSVRGAGSWTPGMTEAVTLAHPVENVSWNMCSDLLSQHMLRLPTEDEWEYACRAGTTTPWTTGRDPDSLVGYANLLDRSAARVMPQVDTDTFDDGFSRHAPVGSFLPNAFGLFDVHGNVSEWCFDDPHSLHYPAVRGGGWHTRVAGARSSDRNQIAPEVRTETFGLRPARRISR